MIRWGIRMETTIGCLLVLFEVQVFCEEALNRVQVFVGL